ncbi:MAG: glutathione S-transferase family protein [Gaiellaceae bacterium]
MIRVYRIPFSTNVERVALAAGHKGVAIEWVDVDPADRTPVRELSGQELVPVLEADGDVVADSTAILEWLEARFPEPALFGPETRIFVDWFNRVWKVPPNRLNDEGPDQALERELADSRDLFEALLAGRDYLYGEFSAADCAAFPFLKYALWLDPADAEPFHHVVHRHLKLSGRHPRLEAWIHRVDAHPRA